MKALLLGVLVVFVLPLMAQQATLNQGAFLEVIETSGLILLNDKFYTHNDSGDGPFIYEIDIATGEIIRTIFVENASSDDWEEITNDNNYLYIGDFGNNGGGRSNLAVFKVDLVEFANSDTVRADTISFNYSDQTSFSWTQNDHNYDCEAMLPYGDSLYLFTKNWNDLRTRVYALSKDPGSFTLEPIADYDAGGMVTGAAFNPDEKEVLLCGYGFLWRMRNFGYGNFFSGNIEKNIIIPPGAIQTEAICYDGLSQYILTTESYQGKDAQIYYLDWPMPTSIEEEFSDQVTIFPNPSKDVFSCSLRLRNSIKSVKLYNSIGEEVAEYQDSFEAMKLPKYPGTYFVLIEDVYGRRFQTKVVVNKF